MTGPISRDYVVPDRLSPDELLEQLRVGDHAEAYKRSPQELQAAADLARKRMQEATEIRGRIKTAAAGREPTAAQKRDLDTSDTARREYQVLAQRLAETAQHVNEYARQQGAEQIARGEVEWANNDLDAPQVGRGYHTGGGNTYQRDDHRTSWVRDLVSANLRSDSAAAERLARNNREVATEHRALSNTNTAGGEWVPPLWMVNEGLRLARPGRVVADQVGKMQLPAGTDSISLPRMATGTAVAEQATQNTAVQNTDATTDSITADVVTIAGQQVLSNQLIDQSPVPIDHLVLQDLFAALAVKTDQFVLSNNATNKVGVLSVSGINAITYTDATPTVGELYPKVADAIQQIHTGRYLPPSKIFMHPRRWAWFTSASDTAGRPLVVPSAQMPQNAVASMGGRHLRGVRRIPAGPTRVRRPQHPHQPRCRHQRGPHRHRPRRGHRAHGIHPPRRGVPRAPRRATVRADGAVQLRRRAGRSLPEVHLGDLRYRPRHPDILMNGEDTAAQIAALRSERDGYLRYGRDDRAEQVTTALEQLGEKPEPKRPTR